MTLENLKDNLNRAATGLTQLQFEAIVFSLSPQERRLFLYLNENGTTGTVELREQCAIGNISQAKTTLNQKLKAAGDDRRVMCQVSTINNRYGESGQLGFWSLVSASELAANDG